jgi:hypothetical protein
LVVGVAVSGMDDARDVSLIYKLDRPEETSLQSTPRLLVWPKGGGHTSLPSKKEGVLILEKNHHSTTTTGWTNWMYDLRRWSIDADEPGEDFYILYQ